MFLAFFRAAAAFALLWLVAPLASDRAQADIYITVNKAAQRMTVMVDGKPRYNWAISTGLNGGPPSGTFRPQRMERMWHSRTYDWSPMPHSIFFHHGFAIHGTNYVSRLGRPCLARLRAAASVQRRDAVRPGERARHGPHHHRGVGFLAQDGVSLASGRMHVIRRPQPLQARRRPESLAVANIGAGAHAASSCRRV